MLEIAGGIILAVGLIGLAILGLGAIARAQWWLRGGR
jgi:hypothetical protein